MPLYSPGRRRAILLLLLTSALLLTLDLRGTAILDSARQGFQKVMEPLESAAEVVSKPVRDAWRGINDYDEVERENFDLQEQLAGQRSDQIAGRAAISAYQQLLALNDLPTLSDYTTVTAAVEGDTPSNSNQVIEINKGSDDGIEVGMPVTNSAGLVGKITAPLLPDRAFVMLITDPRYVVGAKVVAPPPPSTTTTTPATVVLVPGAAPPSTETPPASNGPPTASSSTTTTSSTTTSSTTTTTVPTTTAPVAGAAGDSTTSTAPTTTLPPTTTTDPQRDIGRMSGHGPDALPQVDFLQDTPVYGRVERGDIVLTSGGTTGLAPPDIPIGLVENVISRSTADGPLIEVTPLAVLEGLQFVKIVLYKPSTEADLSGDVQADD